LSKIKNVKKRKKRGKNKKKRKKKPFFTSMIVNCTQTALPIAEWSTSTSYSTVL